MEENWNFHTFIAVPLEQIGKSIVGSSFLTADEIDNGQFVDAMLLVLSILYGNEKINDFYDCCRSFDRINGREMDKDEVEALFSDFKRLVDNKREDR